MRNKKFIIAFVICIIVFVFLCFFKNELLKIIYPRKYEEIVSKYYKEYGVDKNLIYAVIKAESNFNSNAESNKGAIGLMQLMENTARDVVIKNDMNEINLNNLKEELRNSEYNIKIGVKYLSVLSEKYNNTAIALAAYNAGSGNVDNWLEKKVIKSDGSDIEKIPFKETNLYIRKILRDYEIYERLYVND